VLIHYLAMVYML